MGTQFEDGCLWCDFDGESVPKHASQVHPKKWQAYDEQRSDDFTKRIGVTQAGFEIAKGAKREGETWDEYVRRCAENPPQSQEFVDVSELGLEGPNLTYDDVVAACKKAMEDSLPEDLRK